MRVDIIIVELVRYFEDLIVYKLGIGYKIFVSGWGGDLNRLENILKNNRICYKFENGEILIF